ncbi:unnamed protein product [Adineta ricciae]|uniref:G-protein coupled receptors family 1 profile domain-containing protein n=1 Tax=Adineta ricciae TaxID=249248 RepID=A0A813SE50_ADIRI|nr:unnamed protein product [Adineta ricciae]CAF1228569.1 unnamed protein product [Adineta ricciae]
MLDQHTDLVLNTTIPSITTAPNHLLTYYFVPIYTILFFIGTFGNGLVFISILRSSRLRTVTNTYLLHIAIADFLLLLSIPFLIVTILANGWIFGNVLCKMYYNFIHINQYVSSLLLAALSFDRYLAVCHPIRAIEFRTRTKSALIIFGCWLISILFLCPTWVFATVTSDRLIRWFGYQVQRCVIDFPSIIFTIPPEIVFTYYGFLIGFLLPVSMITTFYILVLIRLHHIRRKHQSELKQRSHRKVTRVVLAVITAYFICWVPYWFLQIFITIDPLIQSLNFNFSIFSSNPNVRFLKELTHLTTIIGYANNCLNPVLYVFLSDTFREEYLMVLNCFQFNRSMRENNLQLEIIRQYEKKSKPSYRTPSLLRKRREIAIKKAKHSVFIDDIPLEYRSLTFAFPRSNNEAPCPSPSRLSPGLGDKTDRRSSCKMSPNRQVCFLSQSAHHSAPARLGTKSSTYSNSRSAPITDDGGVYCGE